MEIIFAIYKETSEECAKKPQTNKSIYPWV